MLQSNRTDPEVVQTDLVALSLAIWLALLLGVSGVGRLHLPTSYSAGLTVADSYRMALAFGG